ncbi:interleukin-17F-like [Sebastes fasciatus]|uniref:interleukin-17F-like n=1 Tax=Sebastes fasciatus TaxID=394691 RepID=UPI003D9E4205
MFSTANSSKVMAACVVAMMMMMMMMAEGAALTKHPAKTHKNSSVEAAGKMVHLQIDPKAFVPIKTTRPLQDASISPWTYNTTQDDSLLHPLSEARCSLRGCRDSEGREDLNLESRPIMHQVLLLRRVKSAGEETSYHFKLESRLIAVGCTCVRPIVLHQA